MRDELAFGNPDAGIGRAQSAVAHGPRHRPVIGKAVNGGAAGENLCLPEDSQRLPGKRNHVSGGGLQSGMAPFGLAKIDFFPLHLA